MYGSPGIAIGGQRVAVDLDQMGLMSDDGGGRYGSGGGGGAGLAAQQSQRPARYSNVDDEYDDTPGGYDGTGGVNEEDYDGAYMNEGGYV